jgi:hypothetical protein
MPAVVMDNREQYARAIKVLLRVGGSWQGVGQQERYLLVNQAQYDALVDAGVVTPTDNGQDVERSPLRDSDGQ